jgi:hypothetical protein
MAEQKADQKRREAERKTYEMMVERKADQEKREAERKPHQEDLQNMQEMMDANQTKTDDNQEGMDIDLKETREEIKSGQAEMKSIVNAFQEKMDASIANRKEDRKETMSCQVTTTCHEATDTDLENIEPDPGTMQSVEEHQEIPKEAAAVMPVGGLGKRRRDRNLAAGRRQKPKGRFQASRESRRRLTVAGRKMSRHSRVAWRKRKLFKKIGTQGNCGPRMRLTVSRRKTTRRATVAWCSENVARKDWTRNHANEEPRNDKRTRRNCGNALNATMT